MLKRKINSGWLLILLGAIVIVSSCNQAPPKASFTAQPRQAMVGEEIFFTNGSENYLRSLWSFGDEAVSRDVNPSHIYLAPGDYQVSLTVFNRTSSDAIGLKVTILEPEVPVDLTRMVADTGLRYQFCALSTLPVEWKADEETVSEDSAFIYSFSTRKDTRIALYMQGTEYLIWDTTFMKIAESKPVPEVPAGKLPVTQPGPDVPAKKLPAPVKITSRVTPNKIAVGGEIRYSCDATMDVIWDFSGEESSTRKSGKMSFSTPGAKTVILKNRTTGKSIETFSVTVIEGVSSQEITDMLNKLANDGASRAAKREITTRLVSKTANGPETPISGQGSGNLSEFVNKLLIESSPYVQVTIRAEIELDAAGGVSGIRIVEYTSREIE